MRSERGFTLIELMIVVAIIAILAAIATPAYLDYVARSQVTEGLGLATGAKAAVVDYYSHKGAYPPNNTAAGMFQPASINGKYVQSVTVRNDGRIEVIFNASANARIASQTLVMTARDDAGAVSWSCSGLSRRYIPSPCN